MVVKWCLCCNLCFNGCFPDVSGLAGSQDLLSFLLEENCRLYLALLRGYVPTVSQHGRELSRLTQASLSYFPDLLVFTQQHAKAAENSKIQLY